DFALVDAIEAGLVKIPRMPTDDNSGAAVPKYRNLWEHVKASLPRPADEPDLGNPLTDYLMHVDGPLRQLAGEWRETFERWRDARNVTQILGLRAFTSQLLCEQVVGRGLRRSSYDDLSVPEYVDVYGVPFQLLPFAKATDARVIEPPRTTSVIALRDRAALTI